MRGTPPLPSLIAALAVVAALCWAPIAARADTVVKACELDGAYGEGMTLREALQAGGAIRFDCPAGTVMKVVGRYVLTKPVEIEARERSHLTAAAPFARSSPASRPEPARSSLRNFERAVVFSQGTIEDCQFAAMSAADRRHGSQWHGDNPANNLCRQSWRGAEA